MTADWKERASLLLHSVAKAPVRPYSHTNGGREKNTDCISVIVEEPKNFLGDILNNVLKFADGLQITPDMLGFPGAQKRALEILFQLRPNLPSGTVCFTGTTDWYDEPRPNGVELVVGPANDQFDILRLARTDAVNCDLTTEDIIATLKKYDSQYGIDIFHAEADKVEFIVKRIPSNLGAWVDELYEFCNDAVDQGYGSKEEWAKDIRETGRVGFWWD